MLAMHAEQRPVTVACNITWPFVGMVTVGGETVTVTLLGLKLLLLPVPHPAVTISRTSEATNRAR
jgi:hypothetical protein